jgi:hypothetical protein
MSEAVTRGIIGAIGAALGVGVGLAVAWSTGATPAPSEATSAESSTDTEPPGPVAMVCASSSRGAEALWGRWCEAQLEEQVRRTEMVRLDWPEDAVNEAPEAWVEGIERAVDACGLPLAVRTVECTEYPCLATIEVRDGVDIDAALADCPALKQAFPDAEIGTHTSRVRCQDGSLEDVDVLYAYAIATLNEAVAPQLDEDDDPFFESFRVLGRRLDAVVTTHGCGE